MRCKIWFQMEYYSLNTSRKRTFWQNGKGTINTMFFHQTCCKEHDPKLKSKKKKEKKGQNIYNLWFSNKPSQISTSNYLYLFQPLLSVKFDCNLQLINIIHTCFSPFLFLQHIKWQGRGQTRIGRSNLRLSYLTVRVSVSSFVHSSWELPLPMTSVSFRFVTCDCKSKASSEITFH